MFKNPSSYGKRRAITLEFRVIHVPTGEKLVLYPGQFIPFCRAHQLNHFGVFSRRSRKPSRIIPLYSFKEATRQKQKSTGADFYLLPANFAQVRP